MKKYGEQIAEWAHQMGVTEDALRQFLSESSTLYGDATDDSVVSLEGSVSQEERELALIEAERLVEVGTFERSQSRFAEAHNHLAVAGFHDELGAGVSTPAIGPFTIEPDPPDLQLFRQDSSRRTTVLLQGDGVLRWRSIQSAVAE